MSRLVFPLDSSWYGLEINFHGPKSELHFEWMTPQQGIDGRLEDYDWIPPPGSFVMSGGGYSTGPTAKTPFVFDPAFMQSGGTFTDLGYARERWIDGQMLDLDWKVRRWKSFFGLPVETWPLVGFRWQRFHLMCYDGIQVKSGNRWLTEPETYEGDVIAFHQQYYIGYLGSQFRGRLAADWRPPVDVIFQWDLGYADGYNKDHLLLREGDRYTMENTAGLASHLAISVEAELNKRWSVGFQADLLAIDTKGTHRWYNKPEGIDQSWPNGVEVSSRQTWLGLFVRLEYVGAANPWGRPRRTGRCTLAFTARPYPRVSNSSVTGPSLTSSTCMCWRNRPVATSMPWAATASTNTW